MTQPNQTTIKPEDILMGIDHGKTNIGIALGRNGFVTPIKVISGKNSLNAVNEINRVIIENRITKIVMGLPLSAEGKETPQSREVRTFAKLLKTFSKKPVDFHSEFRSTQDAAIEAQEKNLSYKKEKSSDHFSAAIILKRYYEEQGFSA